MNTLHLARCLGDISTPAFQRHYYHRQLELLDHDTSILFNRKPPSDEEDEQNTGPIIAHRAGTNCLAIDQTQGRYLISGGADTFIRLWDLETPNVLTDTVTKSTIKTHHATASISKTTPSSHTHSITSLSIYPHDPTPQTLLTTSYDQSLLLTSITPTSLTPLHSFPLDFTVHTHSTSPHPSQPLVAVGTSHAQPRLIDLRTGLSTHSLPGHNGAIYSLAWHPKREHTLTTSSTDGRILTFDIRRATPAFASFSLDDSLGVTDPSYAGTTRRQHLDFTHRAHEAPITGIVYTEAGDKLISAAQDQRIRVWDVATGRSDLVHFGPRIRNAVGREGETKPVLLPRGMAGGSGMKGGREVLFWPNDDGSGKGKGEVFVCEVREGGLKGVLKGKSMGTGVGGHSGSTLKSGPGRGGDAIRGRARGTQGNLRAGTRAATGTADRLSHGGRINALAFRPVLSDEGLGGSLEMYSAHGDGRICVWNTSGSTEAVEDDDEDGQSGSDGDSDDEIVRGKQRQTEEEIAAEKSRKRKRELIEGLVEGLTKKPVTFS